MRRLSLYSTFICLIALAACIPAKTPPQLSATAAPGIVVSGELYDAGVFRVHFPSGWRTITSPAGAPVSVIFASPDNCALISVSSAPIARMDPKECAPTVWRDQKTLTLGGSTLYTALVSPEPQWDTFQAIFDQVTASVEVDGTTG